jgi:hypothetical protein
MSMSTSTSASTIHPLAVEPAIVDVQRSGRPVAMASLVLDAADGIDVSCHIASGQLPTGVREELVDAIFAAPEVQSRRRIRATIPLGDSTLLDAIRARCRQIDTCLIDATMRRDSPAHRA